jgi:hypothetical protein
MEEEQIGDHKVEINSINQSLNKKIEEIQSNLLFHPLHRFTKDKFLMYYGTDHLQIVLIGPYHNDHQTCNEW